MGTEERMNCSEEITHIWSAVDLVMGNVTILSVWTSAEKDESND